MLSDIWYEVFINKGKEGTETLARFDTVEEAKQFKGELEKSGKTNLHVDEWRGDIGWAYPTESIC